MMAGFGLPRRASANVVSASVVWTVAEMSPPGGGVAEWLKAAVC